MQMTLFCNLAQIRRHYQKWDAVCFEEVTECAADCRLGVTPGKTKAALFTTKYKLPPFWERDGTETQG